MAICENRLNAMHGGALCTLADLALVAAATSHCNMALVVNTDVSFLKAYGQETRTLFSEATEVFKNFKRPLPSGSSSPKTTAQGFAPWGERRVEKLKPNQDHLSQADTELHHTYPINP